MKEPNFNFFALAAWGQGVSGGDRIFIELARNWSAHTKINLYLTQEGVSMCQRQKLTGKHLTYKKIGSEVFLNFLPFRYIYKILLGFYIGLTLKLRNTPQTYIYSASEFWMDAFPCVILKIRYKNIKWVAAWYQTAPNPLRGFATGKRVNTYKLSAFVYWFLQLPIKPLVNKYASLVLVNNETERIEFEKMNKKGKVFVLIGAVRLDDIEKYKRKTNKHGDKKWLAVFQGRFHPQKGVVELVHIWKKVTDRFPDAKLAMIGDGPLFTKVKKEIERLKLERNIKLFGYVFDGEKKYDIFSESYMVVHPAFFDSGGMAAAEAMAFGLPCVGFNLPSYKSYYPKGMVKVAIGDLEAFSNAIMKLKADKKLYSQILREGYEMIKDNWSWNLRAREVYNAIAR